MAQTQKQRWAQDIHEEKVAERAGEYITVERRGRSATAKWCSVRVFPTGERKRGPANKTRTMAVHVAHLHARMWEIPYIDPDEVITELSPEVLGTAAKIVPYIAPEFAEADDFRQQALQAGNCPRRVDRAIALYRNAGQYIEKAAHYGTTVHGCGCPDAEAQRARKCKHVLAAIMRRRAGVDADDATLIQREREEVAFEVMRDGAF